MTRIVLASSSSTRLAMLRNAGIETVVDPARIDEPALREALDAEHASPRDIADALADAKARKRAPRHPDDLVLGCDQVLDHDGHILSKADDVEGLRAQLVALRGSTHRLLSAAVIYQHNTPIWRHVGVARLTMRSFSDASLDAYVTRNWPDVAGSVGGYRIEAQGIRLFERIEGDYFTILGLPLIELLNFLSQRGDLAE